VNYLTATGIDVGLLFNFGAQSLQFKRKARQYPDLRTTGVWRSLERRIQIPRRCSLFPSFPSVLPTEGNEENEKEGNWVCAS
jgi:hypothetical protein